MTIYAINSNHVSRPRPVPKGGLITVTPDPGAYVYVEYTTGSLADVNNGVAAWHGWPLGNVSRSVTAMASGRWLIRVTPSAGNATYEIDESPSAASVMAYEAGFAALAEGNNTVYGSARKGVASAKAVNIGVIGQFPDKSYIAWDYRGYGNGYGAGGLCRITGDPAAYVQGVAVDPAGRYTCTSIAGTRVTTVAAGLKSAANVAVADATIETNGTNTISNVYMAKNGDVFFLGECASGYYLWRGKFNAGYTTFSIGADAGYSDKKAVLDIGVYNGAYVPGIRALSQRSFCEATVLGATHYFFCEYNVVATINRTPGSTNDGVRIFRSTDLGATWEVFLEWNTDGSTHTVTHIHGAKQDPYSGWIYFMTGDTGAENALIGYNGTAAKVAINSSYATIAATPGYRALSGSELYRHTDLLFRPQAPGIFGIPDADGENGAGADTTSTAYVTTQITRNLDMCVSAAPIPTRKDGLPPILALQTPNAGALMLGFRGNVGNTPNDPYIELWSADVEDGLWQRIGRFKVWIESVAVPGAFFEDDKGRVWFGGTTRRNVALYSGYATNVNGNNASTTNHTTSMVLTLGPRSLDELVYTQVNT